VRYLLYTAMTKHPYPIRLSANTGSESALNFALDSCRRCELDHQTCGLRKTKHHCLPTRLIDVGQNPGDMVCVVLGADLSRGTDYTTLSHCWGSQQPFMLSRSTASQLSNGISPTILPKTFQDAITVTRKFEVRYIWIDSLYVLSTSLISWL
jgi:hypothetical protein